MQNGVRHGRSVPAFHRTTPQPRHFGCTWYAGDLVFQTCVGSMLRFEQPHAVGSAFVVIRYSLEITDLERCQVLAGVGRSVVFSELDFGKCAVVELRVGKPD